jgi:hypothetical protein
MRRLGSDIPSIVKLFSFNDKELAKVTTYVVALKILAEN